MSDLPPGWEWGRLSDLGVEVRDSVRPERGTSYELYSVPAYPTGRPEMLDGTEIGSTKRVVAPGDVLLCKINPRINRVWIVGRPSGFGPQIASTEYFVFRTPEPGLSVYLRWYFLSPGFRRWIELTVEGATGSHTRAKSGPILAQFMPIPPLAEAGRMVAIIEEHLSRLDAAEIFVRSAVQRLKGLTQRLRDVAVEGESVPLRDLLREPLRNGLSAPTSSVGSIRVATLTAVTKAAFVDAHTKLIKPDVRPVNDLWMEQGDIFVQRSNTPELVGTAALYKGPRHWAIFPDLLIRVRVDEARADPNYVELVLRSAPLRRYFRQSARGVAGSMPKVSQPIVESAGIPLPSLKRQRFIVSALSDDLAIVQRMTAEVERARARARLLRHAVFTAAFSGRLVPQNPEDEPALVLIERLQSQRAAASSTPRHRMQATS